MKLILRNLSIILILFMTSFSKDDVEINQLDIEQPENTFSKSSSLDLKLKLKDRQYHFYYSDKETVVS